MRRLLFAAVCLFTLMMSAVPSAADWPTFANNNARVATTEETLSTSLTLRWHYQSTSAPRTAFAPPRSEPIEGQSMRHRVKFDDALQVVLADGRAYFGSQVDHQVRCLNAATGELVWKFYTGGPVRLSPTIADGRVYFGSDDGYVYCLQANDGTEVWKYRSGPREERLLARGQMISRWPVRTGVLVDDDVAYFGAGVFPHETIYLCAVNATTGKLIWKNDRISHQDAQRNDLSPQGYLLANADTLFVPSGRALPVAVDRKSGEILHGRKHAWRSTAGGVVGGTSALLGDGQIYASGPHHFLAMGQKDGGVGHSWIKGRQMTLVSGDALIATGEQLIRVDRKAHAAASIERQDLFIKLRKVPHQLRKGIEEERERLANVGIRWSAADTADGALAAAANVAIVGGRGRVTAYDIKSGEQVWNSKVEGEVRGVAIADGMLTVSTTSGDIYAFGEANGSGDAAEVRRITAETQPVKIGGEVVAKAQKLLAELDDTRGFALVMNVTDGKLAYELARQSDLTIIGLADEDETLDAAREMLSQAGVYGHRVTLFKTGPTDELPNYFANLVVSESPVTGARLEAFLAYVAPHTKPHGGTIVLDATDPPEKLQRELQGFLPSDQYRSKANDGFVVAIRGKLPGAGQWANQYGDTGNTSNSHDHRVKGGLGVLWYGDPGPGKMINRHEAAVAPLATAGRMFIQGTDSVSAWDSYNGQFLWEQENPGAIRTGVFNNEDVSNLAASDDSLFVVVDDHCTQYDAATGKVNRVHKIPDINAKSEVAKNRVWGYVAAVDGKLFGTSTVRSELRRELRRRGRTVQHASDGIFAIDLKTGERVWTYDGKNLMHQTIAIADGRIHFIDSTITSEERAAYLREDKAELANLTGEAKAAAEKRLKERDLRLAVALDAATGQVLWSKPVDVTDMSHLSIGGGQMTLMAADGKVVICGANANGHYWRQFLAGEFSRRRLLVLDAKSGEKVWAKDANYRHRPIIVDDKIIAEPWAFDLANGEEIKRIHPITGEPSNWMFSRPGHHCGAISASPNMLLFRSGFTAYYDLYEDSGTRHFAGQRLGCWINAIPGNGLVMMPESSAGCVCLFPIAATVVMEPRDDRQGWGIYSDQGARTPVKKLALNLGGPGDRRDSEGRLWMAYPRPKTVGRLEYTFDIEPRFANGGEFFSGNSESVSVEGEGVDWVASSGARGLASCTLPILGKGDQPADYTVTLHFTQFGDTDVGEASFDVKFNGQVVEHDVDVFKEAGGIGKTLAKTFPGVQVENSLTIELVQKNEKTPAHKLPLLGGIEVTKE